jgi:hypothetical protein
MTAQSILLLAIAALLCVAWVLVLCQPKAPRKASQPVNPPCGGEAFLSAVSAATHRMSAAAKRMEDIAERAHRSAPQPIHGEYVEFQRVDASKPTRLKAPPSPTPAPKRRHR